LNNEADRTFWRSSLSMLSLGDQSVIVVTTVDGYWNIQFEEIQKQDEGDYFCVAENKEAVPSSRTSKKVNVRVGGKFNNRDTNTQQTTRVHQN